MGILVQFATTGRIGEVRPGMSLTEAQEILGPGQPHPVLRMRPDAQGYPHSWESLSLLTVDGTVTEVRLILQPGERFGVPATLWPDVENVSATVAQEAFTAALREAGSDFAPYDPLTLSRQEAILTNSGVIAIFGYFSSSARIEKTGSYLFALRCEKV